MALKDRKTPSATEAKVFTAKPRKQRGKITAIFLLTILAALITGFVILRILPRQTDKLSRTLESSKALPSATPELVQPDIPLPSANTEKKSVARQEAMENAPPEPVDARYNVTLESTTTWQHSPGIVTVQLTCILHDQSNDPGISAIINRGRINNVVTNSGSIKNIVNESGELDKDISISHRGRFNLKIQLPDSTTQIQSIDCVAMLIRADTRKSVTWINPESSQKQTQESNGFKFTLLQCRKFMDFLDILVIQTLPKDGATEPQNWPIRFLESKIRCSDGSLLTGQGAAGRDHLSERYTLNGKTPHAYEISFVPSIQMQEVPFRLRDIPVKAPAQEPTAAATGFIVQNKVISKGFTFNAQSLEVKRDPNGTRLELRVIASRPLTDNVLLASPYIQNATATDDVGGSYSASVPKTMDAPTFPADSPSMSLSAAFSPPGPKASRLESFSGVYRVIIADKKELIEFPFPPEGHELPEPIKMGYAALTTVSIAGDSVVLDWNIESNALASGLERLGEGFWAELIDAAGNSKKAIIGNCKRDSKNKRIGYMNIFKTEKFVPAKIVIHVTKSTHSSDIPFEFKNLLLPVKAEGNDATQKF